MHLVPAYIPWIWCIRRPFPVPYMESRRSCFRTDSCIYAPRRSIDEVRRIRLFPYCHVSDAGSSQRTKLDIPDSDGYLRCVWCLLGLCSNRPEIHQCLLFRKPLRFGTFRYPDDESDSLHRCCTPDAFTRINDSPVLCSYRYDLRTYPHP